MQPGFRVKVAALLLLHAKQQVWKVPLSLSLPLPPSLSLSRHLPRAVTMYVITHNCQRRARAASRAGRGRGRECGGTYKEARRELLLEIERGYDGLEVPRAYGGVQERAGLRRKGGPEDGRSAVSNAAKSDANADQRSFG
eukprot:3168045-Rhodomonas_salina.1